MLGGSRSLRVVIGAFASSLKAVAVARRSWRRCRRHSRRRCLRLRTADAPGAGLFVPPRLRRRGARLPLFRGSGSLSQRSVKCSVARALCVWSLARSLPLWRRSPSHGAHGADARDALGAASCGPALALLAPALSCHRSRGGVTLGRHSSSRRLAFSARCVVLRGSYSLRVVVGAVASSLMAVAVVRRSQRRCRRRSRRR